MMGRTPGFTPVHATDAAEQVALKLRNGGFAASHGVK
jgi:hypothetical protein